MHFLITGHTGFKGAWLAMLLKATGNQVSGISLAPEKSSIFNSSNLDEIFENNIVQDIRNIKSRDLPKINIDVVVHLAAQPLVKASYEIPIETFETNVIGTLNVLELTKKIKPKATLIITTDKVYSNDNSGVRFQEENPLFGHDPYSASKVATESVASAWSSISPRRSSNLILLPEPGLRPAPARAPP